MLNLLKLALVCLLVVSPMINGDVKMKGKQDAYHDAIWNPLHFKPAAETAQDEDCLECHREILERKPLETSPAGVKASESLAWYQTLDTYKGDQDTFHRRHLLGEYAKSVMSLKCNTCHQGNDPREETAHSSATGDTTLTQRKMVDPDVCLMCHGQFPDKSIMNLPGSWEEVRDVFQNNCNTCHVAIRTTRHQVNFLKADEIEAQAGEKGGDVCYGCHGGRAWYHVAYPYPRHTWPGMATQVPDWATDRPTKSQERFRLHTAPRK